MPNSVVKTKKQEKLWKKAEDIAIKKFGNIDSHYDYVMGIYKNMGGLKEDFISKVRSYLKNV